MSTAYSLAVSQVERIAQLCDFLAHPGLAAGIKSSVPVTMPQSERSLGFDTPLWVGLGIVGLWAALDAFAERVAPPTTKSKCPTCGKCCFPSRLTSTGKLDVADEWTLEEVEDLRNLFAHNYAGHADAEYFGKRKRHVLASGVRTSLSSGAVFNGEYISLTSAHLRHYAGQARGIIGKLS
jgi:hypothetical protein